jgi:hypothetical protein
MSGTVFDDYTDVQDGSIDPAILSTPTSQWGPKPSIRTIATGNGDLAVIGAGLLTITHVSGGIFQYEYQYTDVSGSSFAGIASIQLHVVSVPPLASLKLLLSDKLFHNATVSETSSGGFFTWNLSDFTTINPLIDLSQVSFIAILSDNTITTGTYVFDSLSSTLACVDGQTNILMADGTTKIISDINRGDLVAGLPDKSIIHRVARINISRSNSKPSDLLRFDSGSLGKNIPETPLIMTKNHPIIYMNRRRPAKSFIKFPGVTSETYERSQFDQYNLYDLQFDHDGSYVGNGVTLQSRCPRSQITPLPKELYFDQSLYTDELAWDSMDHELLLDDKILDRDF